MNSFILWNIFSLLWYGLHLARPFPTDRRLPALVPRTPPTPTSDHHPRNLHLRLNAKWCIRLRLHLRRTVIRGATRTAATLLRPDHPHQRWDNQKIFIFNDLHERLRQKKGITYADTKCCGGSDFRRINFASFLAGARIEVQKSFQRFFTARTSWAKPLGQRICQSGWGYYYFCTGLKTVITLFYGSYLFSKGLVLSHLE